MVRHLFWVLLYTMDSFFVAVVDCGTLNPLADGQVSHTAGTTFGQTATYSCDTGYNLVGDSTHTCQANGMWSGREPTCQSRLLLEPVCYVCTCTQTRTNVSYNLITQPIISENFAGWYFQSTEFSSLHIFLSAIYRGSTVHTMHTCTQPYLYTTSDSLVCYSLTTRLHGPHCAYNILMHIHIHTYYTT